MNSNQCLAALITTIALGAGFMLVQHMQLSEMRSQVSALQQQLDTSDRSRNAQYGTIKRLVTQGAD